MTKNIIVTMIEITTDRPLQEGDLLRVTFADEDSDTVSARQVSSTVYTVIDLKESDLICVCAELEYARFRRERYCSEWSVNPDLVQIAERVVVGPDG